MTTVKSDNQANLPLRNIIISLPFRFIFINVQSKERSAYNKDKTQQGSRKFQYIKMKGSEEDMFDQAVLLLKKISTPQRNTARV